MNGEDEIFEVVDEQGRKLRLATRHECHSGSGLLHRVVHVIVFDSRGRLYLQKRGRHKDIEPGKWDTSVGGHCQPGESAEAAARRETSEELGVWQPTGKHLEQADVYIWRSEVENEYVTTFYLVWDQAIHTNPEEIMEGRFWETKEIEAVLGTGVFTPNFEEEFRRWRKRSA